MKYVFFSQPFHGRSEKDIFRERKHVEQWIKEHLYGSEEFLIVDQYHQERPEEMPETWYLARDILMLAKADLICFACDWESSSGCRIEHMVCDKFGYSYLVLPDIS